MKMQPIETAPVDGTHVLLHEPGTGFFEGFFRNGWIFEFDDSSWAVEPTLWAPLPDIEAASKAARTVRTEGDEHTDWRSVKEVNAPSREPLLTFSRNGQVIVGEFDGSMWLDQNNEYALCSVTHWMLLPDPPKEGQSV